MEKHRQSKMCSACKYYAGVPGDGGLGFCSNAATKLFDSPIGFLRSGSPSCNLFQAVRSNASREVGDAGFTDVFGPQFCNEEHLELDEEKAGVVALRRRLV